MFNPLVDRNFFKLTLAKRLVCAFSIILCIFAGNFFYSFMKFKGLEKNNMYIESTIQPFQDAVFDLYSALVDSRDLVTSFIFERDLSFKATNEKVWRAITQTTAEVEKHLATLRDISGNDHTQNWGTVKSHMARLKQAGDAFWKGFEEGQSDTELHTLKKSYDAANALVFDTVHGKIIANGTRGDGLIYYIANDIEALIKDTKDDIASLRFSSTMSLILSFLASIFIAAITIRSIRTPIRHMCEAIGRLALGDSKLVVTESARSDEIGDMARALEVIRSNGITAVQVRSGLDAVSSPIMILDLRGHVFYCNLSLVSLFRRYKSAFQGQGVQFNCEDPIGQSLHDLKRFLDHQIDFESLQNSFKAHLTMEDIVTGEIVFEFEATPIMNEFGERLGTVVEWTDLTEEITVQREVDNIVTSATEGNFDLRVTLDNKQGFRGSLGKGINNLMTMLSATFGDIRSIIERLSKGDLGARVTQNYQGTFEEVKTNLNIMAQTLNDTMIRVSGAAREIGMAVHEISLGSQELSLRTEQQAGNLEETAASMEELAATVRQNSGNAQQANQFASDSSAIAKIGGSVVQEAIVAMERIEQSSGKISEIIAVIDEIAFQTNLLALNAAVEAARAGEAGKGFAVVADEVRSLAQRSAQASKQIKCLIIDSSKQVQEGVTLVHDTGKNLKEITEGAKRVADIIAEIAAASSDQTVGIEQINTAVSHMDEMTQKNAALVQESNAATQSLRDQSVRLQELMSFFQLHNEASLQKENHSSSHSMITASSSPPPGALAKGVESHNLSKESTGKNYGKEPSPYKTETTRFVKTLSSSSTEKKREKLVVGKALTKKKNDIERVGDARKGSPSNRAGSVTKRGEDEKTIHPPYTQNSYLKAGNTDWAEF